MPVINVWDIEPFWPGSPHPNYEQLKSSIRLNGLRNPIIVLLSDSGIYIIQQGRWRVMAARAIGMYQIPVYVVSDGNEPGFFTRTRGQIDTD